MTDVTRDVRCNVVMAFGEEDRIVIKYLCQNKNYSVKRLEFPDKGWKLGVLKALLRKIDRTGSCKRQVGSGRPRTARNSENIEQVQDLVLSQEDRPQTHLTQREIAREVGISETSVNEIVKIDLRLKGFKKRRATELTEVNRMVLRPIELAILLNFLQLRLQTSYPLHFGLLIAQT